MRATTCPAAPAPAFKTTPDRPVCVPPGLPRPDDGFLSYSPSGTQINRHEVFALRFQCLSSVTFEGCLHAVARTSQARLVVPPEPFDATCCKRVFRVLLQLPTRDQVLTTFVYIQNNRQHRRPSVHFHPPSLLVEALPDRRRPIRSG